MSGLTIAFVVVFCYASAGCFTGGTFDWSRYNSDEFAGHMLLCFVWPVYLVFCIFRAFFNLFFDLGKLLTKD